MKYIISILLTFSFLNIKCGDSKKENPMNNKIDKVNQSLNSESLAKDSGISKKEVAIISTDFGEMVIDFFEGNAPKHVESFKLHAKNGYYNGTLFHRVIPGFMIQGGDPKTKTENKETYGTGGHSAKYYGIGNQDEPTTWNLPAEFNSIKHKRGIVSMARSNSPNSGGSQFFICANDAPHLNGKYTVFGQVIEGIQIIDQIIDLPRDSRDNPNRRIEMEVRLEKRNK